jgi:signal transduction histidine kinase
MKPPPSPSHTKQAETYFAEAIRRLYQSLDGEVRWVFLLPLLLVGGLWPWVEQRGLVLWLIPALAVPAWRYVLVRRFLAAGAQTIEPRRWAYRMAATTAADGLVWGVAGFAFFVPDALPPQLVLLAMLIGIPAGSIFINSWWPPSLYAYVIPSLGLTALGLARHATPAHLAMAGGLLVYMAIIYQIMRQAHAAARETIALRFENLELIEQLRHEKQLAEEANLAKSRLLAAASHDLRQPLHALGLFVAALNDRIRHPTVRGLMDNINRCIAALETLFNALLDLSRLDAGIVTAQVHNVPLAPLIEQLEAEYAPQARAKGLAWQAPAAALVVRTDALLLERILRNLLSNAIRYTNQGAVRLACRREDAQVCITVSDTGIGIAREHQQAVFREFFQLHNPEHDRSKGLGLGLAIVERLVRVLGARLEMHSTPGVGTTFHLWLPAGDSNAADEAADAAGLLAAPEELTRRVLVIDDEQAVRQAMTALLEGWGYTVIPAASADEALEVLDQAPDVIVADYRLSEGHTGIEAIHRLRQRFGADIPAMLMTGDTTIEPIREVQESGLVCLHKPVAPAKLRAFLRATGAG